VDTFEFIANQIAYYWIGLLVCAPIGIVAKGFVLFAEYSQIGVLVTVANWIMLAAIVVWIALPGYVAHKAASYRVKAKSGFFESLIAGWAEVRAELVYLPIVGGWFETEASRRMHRRRGGSP
jgi:hypothetical protein